MITLQKGRKYEAQIALKGVAFIAPNSTVAKALEGAGFGNVSVQGGGRYRLVAACWNKEDTLFNPEEYKKQFNLIEIKEV